MKVIHLIAVVALLSIVSAAHAAASSGHDQIVPYPRVVLYSTPWCNSCNAAKDYFLKNNIPFVKKDVDANDSYLEEMAERYKSRAVPVIVIGRDQKVLKGFVPELFHKAFREVLVANDK